MQTRNSIAIAIGILIGSLTGPSAQADIVPANDGTGTQVNQSGSNYTIEGGATSSDQQNLFHSFSDFNLLTGEQATFMTTPSMLNVFSRVTGGNASYIDGLLQVSGSNANLFFINPSGVLFGANSAINLQGDFNVVTADRLGFANGFLDAVGTPNYAALVGNPTDFSFSAAVPGSIVNAGDLAVSSGNSLRLIGGQVINTGTLTAPGGDIIISAIEGGQFVRIQQTGQLLNLEVATLTENAGPSLPFTPTSLPTLLTGNAIATASGVDVNPDGTITLTGSTTPLPTDSGSAIVGGTISTVPIADGIGGSITVLGETVGVLGAVLDASGTEGGGGIWVGGEYKGGARLPAATVTFIDETSSLTADALLNGNGGRIIVWSDDTTRSYGDLSARGGALAGDGGFVETSGRLFLDRQGIPDVSATNGEGGAWLIDPSNIEIGEFATNVAFPGGNPFTAPLGTNPTRLSWADIGSALTMSTNLTITTGNTGPGNGDIFLFEGSESLGEAIVGSLTLQAARDIEILAPVSVDGDNFNFRLEAGRDITGIAPITGTSVNFDLIADSNGSGNGVINLESLTTNNGNIRLRARDNNSPFAINVDGPILSGGGNIELVSGSGDIEVQGINAGGGTISLATPDFIFAEGTIVTSGGALITLEHGGNGLVPFEVGAPTLNGVAGVISNGADTVSPPNSFLENAIFGNIRILTNTESDFDEFDCFGNCEDFDPAFEDDELPDDFFEDIFDEDLPDDPDGEGFGEEGAEEGSEEGSEDGLEEELEEGLEEDIGDSEFGEEDLGGELEEIAYEDWALDDTDYANEFVAYFDLPNIPETDFESSQDTLRSLTDTVGTPPALVYARFSPAGSSSVAQGPRSKQIRPFEGEPSDILELILVTPGGQPQRLVVPGATREKVTQSVRQLQIEITDRTRRRQKTYLKPAQDLYTWLIEPLKAELTQEEVGHLSFIMAPGLRSLPIAALHNGEQFIIEEYSVGLMPSLALTDTRYTDLREAPVLAMGASEFADQPDLPAVPFELATIVGQLRQGELSLNESFTPQTLTSLRQASGYDILHLATHGEFRAGGPSNSYIQFWDQRLGLDEIRTLQLNDPPLELLVMSACRTALGDTAAELGFAGLAVQAGVKSALATLWQVSDLETAGLMAAFYAQLNQSPYKAEALRQAQLAMLRGDVAVEEGNLVWAGGSEPLPPELANLRLGNIDHPYYWAAFTLVGSPW
ncbi:MAG: CHAT domain-containing protein [Cyanobacteria bacterium J06638_28]